MGCCVCGADDWAEGWQRWDDHPAQRHWEVIKDLGTGAMSQVVLAQHRQTREYAALKVVFLQSPAVADDPEHLALLQRESDLLAMLDHPNIVECKDVVRSPKQLVLVLEWLRGGQVIDKLHELGLQYSEQQAAAIFAQAAEAVAYLHEYNVLHRDIKPENVMFASPPAEAKAAAPITAAQLQGLARQKKAAGGLGKAGKSPVPEPKMPTVKLVDLGMACLYDPAKPVTGPLGSPGFVAPEIIAGAPHTPAMDVFSLGVLLFIMLVGRKPFNIKESENLRYATMQLQEAPGLKDPRWLDLSPDAKHLVMGMLAYDPARRLTMQQVLEHEWVVSRGGILPRPLGQDVVFGAATVASVRRLRNLCGGVVAFNRAAAAAGGGKAAGRQGKPSGPLDASGKVAAPADSAKDNYLRRLRQSQRLDPSARRGNALHRFATGLASSAYARAHDAGGSVHPAADVSRHGPAGTNLRRGSSNRGGSLRGGSLHGVAVDPSTSRRHRLGLLPSGMPRAGTTVMLSEMDRGSSRSLSRKGSGRAGLFPFDRTLPNGAGLPGMDGPAPGLERRPSTLQLLTSAARVYFEGSVHGSRRGGAAVGAGAAAAAALSGSSGSSGGGALRQVADDSSISRRHRQQQAAAAAGLSPFQAAGPLAFKSHAVQEGQPPADGSSNSSSHSASGTTASTAAASASAQSSRAAPDGAEASGSVWVDTEGRQRGTAAAALAVGAMPRPGTTASRASSDGMRSPLGSTPNNSLRVGSPVPPLPPLPAGAPLVGSPAGLPPGRTFGEGSGSGARGGLHSAQLQALEALRPPVVVRRKSLDNPLLPGSTPPSGRTWAEMQAHLRQQTPRSSREGSRAGGTPSTRVVRIKPLE